MGAEVRMAALDELLRSALILDAQDRATLAEKLLASLDELSEEEAERLWVDVAQKRLSEYRSGRASGVGAQEVAEKAQKLFR